MINDGKFSIWYIEVFAHNVYSLVYLLPSSLERQIKLVFTCLSEKLEKKTLTFGQNRKNMSMPLIRN